MPIPARNDLAELTDLVERAEAVAAKVTSTAPVIRIDDRIPEHRPTHAK
jgi:hypothetical protein